MGAVDKNSRQESTRSGLREVSPAFPIYQFAATVFTSS